MSTLRRFSARSLVLAPVALLGGLGLLQAQTDLSSAREDGPTAQGGGLVFQIEATRDNTLYEDGTGSVSNGSGVYLFAGRTGAMSGDLIRRGVLAFDVASTVPAGSTVTSASIDVFCSRANGGPQTMTLQRLSSDWSEGASDAGSPGGAGAASAAGDATWIHTSFPGSLWGAAGGDFVAAISASTVVNIPDPYVFSSAQLAIDVQDMLDNPATDYGWILRGNESSTNTAKRFDSREINNPGSRPILTVTIAPPPAPAVSPLGMGVLALLLSGVGAALVRRAAVRGA